MKQFIDALNTIRAAIGEKAVFATPTGGLMGLFISAFHNAVVDWRRYLSAFACALVFIFATYGFALTRVVPVMEGRGIIVSDIEVMFEIFLMFTIFMSAYQFRWNWRRLLSRSALALAGLVIVRLAIILFPEPAGQGSLAQWEYLAGSDETALGVTAAAGSCLVVALAALVLRRNKLSQIVDRWVGCPLEGDTHNRVNAATSNG